MVNLFYISAVNLSRINKCYVQICGAYPSFSLFEKHIVFLFYALIMFEFRTVICYNLLVKDIDRTYKGRNSYFERDFSAQAG